MRLLPMRYKNHVWHHNPVQLKISDTRAIRTEKNISGGNISKSTGANCRVFSGTGELYGSDSLNQYEALQRLFAEESSGILCLPELKPLYCFFTKLEAQTSDIPNVLKYNFEFIEDESKMKNVNAKEGYYTASEGENLWQISSKLGLKIETLVGLNPQIKNPNSCKSGERVVVR